MNLRHCCDRLAEQVNVHCDQHPEAGGCSDYLIGFSPKFDEYGLWIHDGPGGSAASRLLIDFCPFCGTALPRARRDDWFDRLELLGLEPEDAPDDMQRYGWWRDAVN